MKKPRAYDLCAGLGGWTEGLLAEGYDVVGFDVERHAYGEHRYPAQLVLQDIRTIHGSQLKDAALIVASPPCQEYSYMAMPWSRARGIAEEYRSGLRDRAKLTELFDACFRIQREAIEAAGRFIPLVVENVRGAQPWVGRSRWAYGSFHLWGDVPALMPITVKGVKVAGMGAGWRPPGHPDHRPGLAFNTHADRQTRAEIEGVKVGDVGWRRDNDIPSQTFVDAAVDGVKVGGPRGDDWFTHHNRPEFEDRATKNNGDSWFNVAHNTTSGKGQNPDGRKVDKEPNRDGWFGNTERHPLRDGHSKSSARKAASARIAKIPLPLARHIAKAWYPKDR